MKYLAIDTSGTHLTVVAQNEEKKAILFLPECAMKHSVLLMEQIQLAFEKAELSPQACDFFAVVVGPGSFTGIRIGIATVKGLCFATDKKAMALTSFDTLAYADKRSCLALVDAGHGAYYACGYNEDMQITLSPSYYQGEEVKEWIDKGYSPVGHKQLFEGCARVDACQGLQNAVEALKGNLVGAEELAALYLRKSSAEEQRK